MANDLKKSQKKNKKNKLKDFFKRVECILNT